METTKLLLQSSFLWVFVCLAAGGLYAWLMYDRSAPWSRVLNYLLATMRAVVTAFLFFILILQPLLRRFINTTEPPAVVLALDNSASLAAAVDTNTLQNLVLQLNQLTDRLKEKNIEANIQTLSPSQAGSGSIGFDYPETDLSSLLNGIQTSYEGRNLASVVLISDGITNKGLSPAYKTYNFEMSAIGVGDTVPRKDVAIKALQYNKIAYLDNKFPIRAELSSFGYAGQVVLLQLRQGDKLIASKNINLKDYNEAEFLVEAKTPGVQHYTLTAQPLTGEFTTKNNSRHAYVEVIDSREKILLLAAAPHPDLKAIRAAIEKQQNYELTVHILSVEQNLPKANDYQLMILHQLPANGNVAGHWAWIEKQMTENRLPAWFIVGPQTSFPQFNKINSIITIQANSFKGDEVKAAFNGNFAAFNYAEDNRRIANGLPPLYAPFGQYSLKANARTLAWQQIGRVVTEKPLMAFSGEGRKGGVLAATGLWQWRIAEYQQTQSYEATDELIQKMVQYLSARDDKRKFRVYTLNNEVNTGEPVVFEAELYNDAYEPVYNQAVSLQLQDEENRRYNYSYTATQANPRFDAGSLPAGVYKYTATTNYNGKKLTANGQFVVTQRQLENLTTTANFNLLREVASQNGGHFYLASQIGSLADSLLANPPKGLIRTSEDTTPLIDLKYLFFVVLLLVSVEWFIRKFKGGY